MTNNSLISVACVAALACLAPAAAFAAPKTSPSPSASPHSSPAAKSEKTTTERAIPFHGKISTVDQSAKTFTIAGKETSRVFKVTDKTVLTKAGAPATMSDVAANEDVAGSYWKAADGSLEAKTVKLGPKTESEKETKTTKKKAADAAASPSASPKP